MFRYAITNRTLFPLGSSAHPYRELVERCSTLADEGVDMILVREKDLSAGALAALAGEILSTVRRAGGRTKVLIASRLDIALATGLDGVHISSRSSELTPKQVRTLYRAARRPEPAITLSCHTLPEISSAVAAQPTAILFGPVFGKTVAGEQITPPIGLEVLRHACIAAGSTPVLALGGIKTENIPSCRAAGAAGIAAIRLFMSPSLP